MSGAAPDAAAANDATVVWMAPAPPRVGEERAIAAWAAAKGLRLLAPRDAVYPVLPSDPRDDGVAAAIDASLSRARDAITAGDGAAADAATAEAEATVLGHAELPNASWLFAEVLRTRATRLRRIAPVRPAEADTLWKRADALDGGRVAGVGEQAAAEPPAPATLAFEVAPDTRIRLDGRVVGPGVVATSAGPHALVVLREDAPIWAGWVEVPAGAMLPGATILRWPLRAVPPCSRQDFAAVELRDGSVASPRVQCPAWIAATVATPTRATTEATGAGASDAVLIASCRGADCGPLQETRHVSDWAAAPDWVASSVASHAHAPRWPAWATWTLAAAGVAAASVIAVVAVSSAGSSSGGDTRFVSGGLKPTP